MNGFEKRNTNFKVFCAVLHMDEAKPHLHIDYVPIGHYSRGLPVQNGIAQALKEMGFGTGKDAIARWRQSEYEVLKSICKRHEIELSPPKKSRGSLTVEEYKKYCSEKKRLNEKLQPLREMELAADESIVAGKKQLFSTNFSVSPEEFSQLENQKKAAAVQTLDNQQERDKIKRQKSLLDECETEIVEKKKAYSVRKSELDEREKNIEKSEKRAEDILSEGERKMRAVDEKYAHQIELNKHYNALELELLKTRNESDENAGILSEIRLATGIPVTDNKTDIIEKCKEITEENREIKNGLRRELKLTAEKADEIPATKLLHGALEKSREIEKRKREK